MINNRLIFNNAALSVIQTIVSAILLFFLYRYILMSLGPEQLGIWSIVLASTSVARLSDLGFSGAVVRFVAQHLARDDQQKVGRIVQTAALSVGLLLLVMLIGAYPVLVHILSWAIPKNVLPQAVVILPWAILSLWFGMTAAVFQSALDGCRRMDIRNGILIFCNIFYIGCVIWLVPSYGLQGMAKAQLLQSILLFGLAWFFLRRQISSLPWFPSRWSKLEFKEMLGYAVHFQFSNIAGLLFEPITKFLLSRYGNLSLVGYYEMASQVATKVKALLVSALQAVLPEIASIKDSDVERIVYIYRQSYRLLFFVALPWCVTVTLALPLISILWIGHIEGQFVLFGQILIIGGVLSTLGLPAYFVNLGSARLGWNTSTQIFIGVGNLLLGWILGYYFGGVGVVAAAMIVYVLGHWVLLVVVQQRLRCDMGEIIPKIHRVMILWLALSGLIGHFLYMGLKGTTSDLLSTAISLSVFIAVLMLVISRHSYSSLVYKKIKAYYQNKQKVPKS